MFTKNFGHYELHFDNYGGVDMVNTASDMSVYLQGGDVMELVGELKGFIKAGRTEYVASDYLSEYDDVMLPMGGGE